MLKITDNWFVVLSNVKSITVIPTIGSSLLVDLRITYMDGSQDTGKLDRAMYNNLIHRMESVQWKENA